MLKQFYDYLSEKVIKFFSENNPAVASRFDIQFEEEDQVRSLYESLKNSENAEAFYYKDSNGEIKYESYTLNFNNVKVIVAATIDNIQPDFLTTLRNLVGKSGYEDKAILFIHDTTLDSIINGAESFNKEGMPFHVESIIKDLNKKIGSSNLNKIDKAIISTELDKKKKEVFSGTSSIFEYKELLNVISEPCIEREKYKSFGLFFDDELNDLTGAQLKKRLKENSRCFEIVNEAHSYGNLDSQLEKYFDEKGIDELKSENWKEVKYSVVKKSVDNKNSKEPIRYNEMTCSVEAWDRAEGTTKVKERIRNIIVFNYENKEEVKIEGYFDDYLKKDYLKTVKNAEVTTSGKKLTILLKGNSKDKFSQVVYTNEDGVKFDFRILVVSIEPKKFNDIKTIYSIKPRQKHLLLNTNEDKFYIGESINEENIIEIKVNNQEVDILNDKKNIINISEEFDYNETGVASFELNFGTEEINFVIQGTPEKVRTIDGFRVWKLKREKSKSFEYCGDNKLKFGTEEHCTRDDFKKNLELEKLIIEVGGLSFKQYSDELVEINLDVSDRIKETYKDIIDFMNKKSQLPSLSTINEELKILLINYLDAFIDELHSIKDGDYLNSSKKDLFKVGTIKKEFEDKELLFTPLHPVNIAYQLLINEKIGNEELEDNTLKKLSSTYLLPYISDENDNIYIPIEQSHSPEWTYYVDENLPRYKGSRDFVSKLVQEKIEEFISHFKYLFSMGNNVPIKINLINTGDSKEILQGVFNYYVKQLKKSKEDKLNINPMEIYIYSNKNIVNAFEEVAFNENIEELKELYNLKFKVDNTTTEEDIMNLFREKVQFYSKKFDGNKDIEYAHLTFLEMDDHVKPIVSNMNDIETGVVLNGLISGIPSIFLGDNYRTGFGTKYIDENSKLVDIVTRLNAINVSLTGAPFNSENCKMVSVSNSSKENLEKIYNSSNWVTFINPKVDLNFFKNDPNANDLLIIHYSDQYTTAGGYDAITVTRKSVPYQKLIEEFLIKHGINNAKESTSKTINMFNAINGDWLLRLISRKSHFPKEKISILSAIKLALAYFEMENITWVPISLEEVLRVSGGAGLKKNEGFFSAKNLGFEHNFSTSDDILLVGIEENNEKVKVHYYPIEVKIGMNDNSYINKGVEQANTTKDLLIKTLGIGNENINYNKKIYRNFLMQLTITSAEKLKLYGVGNSKVWDRIIDSKVRKRLLNEEYEISLDLDNKIGRGAVISFKSGNICFNESHIQDNIKVIEYSEDDGINYITKSIEEIKSIIDSNKDTNKYTYSNENINVSNSIYIDVNNDTDNNENGNESKELTEDNKINEEKKEKSDISPYKIEINESILAENPVKEQREMRILFGRNQSNGENLYWYPTDTDKVFHTNTGIIGQMGTGKTQFTKSLITQLYRERKYNVEGKDLGILIFDYKGDYNQNKEDFIKATNAKVYPLYRLPFNPLSIIKPKAFKPMLPLHTASSLAETITRAFRLGAKQNMTLKDIIMEAYERRGISKGNPSTWENPAPTLSEVYNLYIESEGFKEDSLYAALKNLAEFEIFEIDPLETKPLFELINGVTVIDLSGYDPSIQNLVVAITLDLFYSQMQAMGHSKIEGNFRQINKIILVDEADNFLSEDFTSIKKILKEGREFGVGTILSTQLLSHFSTGDNDYSNYILTWIVHSVTEINNKDVKYIFNTQNKHDEELLCNKVKSLTKHYSLVKMGDSNSPIYIKDKAFWELVEK